MSIIKNHVQLIGNVGIEPTITNLESGKKVARLSLATNENYKDSKGEKQTDTNWNTVVAWGNYQNWEFTEICLCVIQVCSR
jgi:single-strand DNA-binding protein